MCLKEKCTDGHFIILDELYHWKKYLNILQNVTFTHLMTALIFLKHEQFPLGKFFPMAKKCWLFLHFLVMYGGKFIIYFLKTLSNFKEHARNMWKEKEQYILILNYHEYNFITAGMLMDKTMNDKLIHNL